MNSLHGQSSATSHQHTPPPVNSKRHAVDGCISPTLIYSLCSGGMYAIGLHGRTDEEVKKFTKLLIDIAVETKSFYLSPTFYNLKIENEPSTKDGNAPKLRIKVNDKEKSFTGTNFVGAQKKIRSDVAANSVRYAIHSPKQTVSQIEQLVMLDNVAFGLTNKISQRSLSSEAVKGLSDHYSTITNVLSQVHENSLHLPTRFLLRNQTWVTVSEKENGLEITLVLHGHKMTAHAKLDDLMKTLRTNYAHLQYTAKMAERGNQHFSMFMESMSAII